MNRALIDALVRAWDDQRGYAHRLVADLSDADMLAQPVRGVVMNHPAWILSHLTAYATVFSAILREEPVQDPADHPHGRNSRPLDDPGAYLPKDELVATFTASYDEVAELMRTVDPAIFDRDAPLERWRERFPRIADVAVQLTVKHMATHLGQLSAWRRAGGRPPV
ncbi:MAG: DinB family protein [Phycisphaeraceae bacterium]|nr:MAG: DinB family protein [Phycisphaeraceae bacterium]